MLQHCHIDHSRIYSRVSMLPEIKKTCIGAQMVVLPCSWMWRLHTLSIGSRIVPASFDQVLSQNRWGGTKAISLVKPAFLGRPISPGYVGGQIAKCQSQKSPWALWKSLRNILGFEVSFCFGNYMDPFPLVHHHMPWVDPKHEQT